MTSTQLWISAIAITVAIVNPWLVARSNRKAAARAASAAPVKKEERIIEPGDWIGWIVDLSVIAISFERVLAFAVSPYPITRLDVALAAIFAAVMFSTSRNISGRINLISARIDRLRADRKSEKPL